MDKTMNNFYLLDKCNSIIDRYLKRTSAFRRGDRKETASDLLKLASEISNKSSEIVTDTAKQNPNTSEKDSATAIFGSMGMGASAGAAIGATFGGPLGMLVGGSVGALVGTSIKGVKSLLNFDDISANITDNVSKEDLNFLVRNSKLALKSIGDQVINTLYPVRLNSLDIRMLMLIADIPFNSGIETINADLGIVSELERYTNQVCVSQYAASNYFENSISRLRNTPRSFQRGSAKLKVLIAESLSYDSASSNPKANMIDDMAILLNLVSQLHSGEKLIAIVPKAMLYNPQFKHIRKELFIKRQLMALMDLKQPASPAARHSCALVFSGNISSKILLLPSGWYRSLQNAFGQYIPDQQLRAMIQSGLSSKNKGNGVYSISSVILSAPFILTPSYQSKKRTDSRFEKLGKVASVVSPSAECYPTVSGFVLSNSDLSKDKPLKPISKGSLEIETFDNPTKWYHIPTDNVVFLHIWNGIVFTGYMEDVKGDNFFLCGPLNRIIILGLNNNSGLRPEYLAQILQSDKYAICQQLLGADYYASSLDALKSAILKIYIPLISEATQYKSIAETTQQQLERINLEWEQKFKEYHSAVRERKHALSQRTSQLRGSLNALLQYCNLVASTPDKKFDYSEPMGKPVMVDNHLLVQTVGDYVTGLKESIEEILELTNYIADVDKTYGDPENFNVVNELKKVVKKLNFEDFVVIIEENVLTDSSSEDININFPLKGFNQIFANIFHNAKRHAFSTEISKHKTPTIKISWSLKGNMIEISIANNGLPLISGQNYFENSSRLRTKDKEGNMSEGIGNVEMKKIIESYGGSVSLHNIEDGDFTVAYTLELKIS